jgi:hypothetical protein
MIDILKPLIGQFLPFAQKRMGFQKPPKLFLKQDDENAKNPLGRTAHYNPAEKSITIYITGRHPKDVLRSLSHELVHHSQCCRGDLSSNLDTSAGYAQKDDHMREMEREAYEVGNMCFRDFEDGLKESRTIYYEHLQKGEKTMSTKDWKNKELTQLLSEAWGFKFNTLQEFDEFNGTGEIQEVSTEDPGIGKEETEGDATDSWEEEGLEETGARDSGASTDDDSKTHPGEKDYTWKKGEDSKTDAGTHDDGSRTDDDSDTGRGKDYVNEDSGYEEKEHDEHNAWSDEDHIEAIEKHLRALKHDRDYEEDHEELKESKTSRLDEEMKKLLKKFLKR